MSKRRIKMGDIRIGEPLRWDVWDGADILILKSGHVVKTREHLDRILKTGFVEACDDDIQPILQAPKESISALRLINHSYQETAALFADLPNASDFPEKIFRVSKNIALALDTNADVAVAMILHNQKNGSYAVRHCVDTAVVATLIARGMDKSENEIQTITAATLTMNIGMIEYHEKLGNSQQPLSPAILKLLRQHPEKGVGILQSLGVSDGDWLSYVLDHHENDEGTGYPAGKKSHEIPQGAKLISLADRYCACISTRNFRKAKPPCDVLKEIFVESKKSDPSIASVFIKELGIYPPGTIVRMRNGEIGVVSKKGKSATHPIVHSLIGSQGMPLTYSKKRDSSDDEFSVKDVLPKEQIKFSLTQVWGEQASA